MDKCENCGEGKDPTDVLDQYDNEWQCSSCEHWNADAPEIKIPHAAVEHMQRWANDKNMTSREMVLSIAFVHEIMRVLDELKKEQTDAGTDRSGT